MKLDWRIVFVLGGAVVAWLCERKKK